MGCHASRRPPEGGTPSPETLPSRFVSTGGLKAFTLVELLVVVMIIAILAALLFPAIQAMPAKANAAKCVNNLRAIGAGIAGYSVEEGRFPPRYGPAPDGKNSWKWADFCLAYMDSAIPNETGGAGIAYYNNNGIGRGFYMAGKKEIKFAHPIFDCPGLANPMKDDEGKPYSTAATHQYHYNGMLGDDDAPVVGGLALSVPRARIDKPSQFIVVMDADSSYLETFGGATFNPGSFAKEYIPSHQGGFHALYADGHVSREELSLITDYKKQGGKWLLPWGNGLEKFSYPNQ